MTQPTLINGHPNVFIVSNVSNVFSQKFHLYPFAIKLDRCVGSCNPLNDISNMYVFQIKQKI